MNTLNFLVIGDSESGKSSFIRNFTIIESATLLDISGRGQTTRCNGIYEFSSDENINNKAEVYFYSKDDFVRKQFDRFIQKNNLNAECTQINSEAKEIYINDQLPTINDDNWYEDHKDIIETLCNCDFISDAFINLEELDIDIKRIFLIKTDIESASNYSKFEEIIKGKLELTYELAKEKIDELIAKFTTENNEEDEDSQKDIKSLKFNLSDDTKFLFTLCIKQTTQAQREKNDCRLMTISGLVKETRIKMKLNPLYEKVCKSVGIDSISFIDTYGLDHEAHKGSIDIEDIRERLKQVLNYEFKEIESVIFITPMLGKAAGTNERFQALIEAKRSIYPQIIYTRFDEYLEEELDKKICNIKESEMYKIIPEFQRGNKNPIKDSFYKILEEYYSYDVALYRKNIILSNMAYFMGSYEKNVDSINAQKFNLIFFVKMIMNIFQKNNMGVTFNFDSTENFVKELNKTMQKNKVQIELKYANMLSSSQKQLKNKHTHSHGNTQQAFWKRIRLNMFGFYNNLDLRRILIEQFDQLLAKDAGDNKDNNLGNYIINDYFTENRLNIFIRECINDFSRFYFCAGCMPCDKLKPGECEISNFCNSTGRIGGRKNRKDNCYQCNNGVNIGSRQMSKFCGNTNIWGIGLFDDNYGKENKCNDRCFWIDFFNYWQKSDKKSISLDISCNVDSFINVFIYFCKVKYINAQDNLANINYLKDYQSAEKSEIDSELAIEKLSTVTQNIILITEGKTDRIHIENAWKKLRKNQFPFFICDIGGADNIFSFLKSYPSELFKNKILMGLFDYDNKGIGLFKSIKSKNSKGNYIKGIVNNNKNYYVVILPHFNKSLEEYEAGEIEFMYDLNLLSELNIIQKRSLNTINNLDYVKRNNLHLNYKEYNEVTELQYFEPISSKKTFFAEYIEKNIEYIEEKSFEGFELFFNLIDDILIEVKNEENIDKV
ncbi:hypothetical protein [Clostridium tagluense]|uniref:hypothetical protein n=1 Tax=Clostridium tagluense TaxID=360422 RepID=UPI001CF3EC7D|nr:hypothetical protein [Clostridium tagluense]MCB2300569.1 hypothetical protein [Clostridium tagluense]